MVDGPTSACGPERAARRRILDAAEVLFARDGFDRTPVSRIAKLADVPHGLVFYYFQTKTGLLLALIRDYSSTLVPALADLPDGDDPDEFDTPIELVTHVMNTIQRQSGARSTFRRILFQEMAAHPEVRQQAQTLHEQATRAMADRIRRGMAVIGSPVDVTTAMAAARLLISAAIMSLVTYERDDPNVPSSEVVAVVARSLVCTAGH